MVNQTQLNNWIEKLDEIEKMTQRIPINSKEISIETEDTSEDLFAVINGVKRRISETAYTSICNKMGICGDGLFALPVKMLRDIILERFSSIEENLKVIIIDGEIRAMLSKTYGVQPTNQVMADFADIIAKKYPDAVFTGAWGDGDYRSFEMRFSFPENKCTLGNIYNKPEWTPGILIRSSDIGFSSVSVYPVWYIGNSDYIEFGSKEESTKKVHRGLEKWGYADAEKALDKCFVLAQKKLDVIQKWANTPLQNFEVIIDEIYNNYNNWGKKDSFAVQDVWEEYSDNLFEESVEGGFNFELTHYDVLAVLMQYAALYNKADVKFQIRYNKLSHIIASIISKDQLSEFDADIPTTKKSTKKSA